MSGVSNGDVVHRNRMRGLIQRTMTVYAALMVVAVTWGGWNELLSGWAGWVVVAPGLAILSSRWRAVGAAVGVVVVCAGVDVATSVGGVLVGAVWRGVVGRASGFSRVDWERRLTLTPAGWWLGVKCAVRPDLARVCPVVVRQLERSAARRAGFVVGVIVGQVVVVTALMTVCVVVGREVWRVGGAVGVFGVSLVIAWLAPLMVTWVGRRMILARIDRVVRYEYWPMRVFYAPLGVYLVYLGIRHGKLAGFTACNPGIANGGGVTGESKIDILRAMDDPSGVILRTELVAAGPVEERVRVVRSHVASDARFAYPVILKPNCGQRGHAVKLVRNEMDARAYFETMTQDAVLQEYHAGPHEVGVMWIRDPHAGASGLRGRVYSITRKEFAFVEGDGVRTVEELVWGHLRYRRQAGVYLARLADEASRVAGVGERVNLGLSGNHCQGTLFRDGADLITPELEAAFDALAGSFGARGGGEGGLDFGRFDVRYADESELRAGRAFKVVELNGSTAESTNIYDPEKSMVWAYRVLFGQWRRVYELGAWRRSRGGRSMRVGELVSLIRSDARKRTGSTIAD